VVSSSLAQPVYQEFASLRPTTAVIAVALDLLLLLYLNRKAREMSRLDVSKPIRLHHIFLL